MYPSAEVTRIYILAIDLAVDKLVGQCANKIAWNAIMIADHFNVQFEDAENNKTKTKRHYR